ncbi:hypothetical protein [Reinekea marinisedimentorum]|uniref:Uncharacterized protein n=1 Tax=Reinekea marinisedimentorum TaxID=230495 RepID=A0A4R3HTU3_9GAMM|nr:hypothetical protein [Reinekea marinisedimentorum]TCS36438.1 hypothetical protein BCF53_12421 [Reinekea marinisedimentorum]
MKLFSTAILLSAALVSSFSLADQLVVQFYSFTYDNTFVADDMEFMTTTYTVVQTYGNEDERLFIGGLREGDWLLLTYDVVGAEKQWIVSKIEILEDESKADEVNELIHE